MNDDRIFDYFPGKFSRKCNGDIHFLLRAMHLKKMAKNLKIEQHLYEYKKAPLERFTVSPLTVLVDMTLRHHMSIRRNMLQERYVSSPKHIPIGSYFLLSTHVPITPKRKSKTPLSEIFFLSPIMYKYSKNPWGQIILMKFLSIHAREVFHKKSWVVVFFCF